MRQRLGTHPKGGRLLTHPQLRGKKRKKEKERKKASTGPDLICFLFGGSCVNSDLDRTADGVGTFAVV